MDKIRLIFLLFLFQCFSVSANDFPAPFGLSWGMSINALNKVGFKNAGASGGFQFLESVTTPKPWSKGDEYLAVIYKNKLVKVIVYSKKITGDLYGREGKKLYGNVKSLLTNKYGEPRDSTELVGLKLYKDSDEFYQCLKYSGCGHYMTVFNYGSGDVGLELKGVSRGEGLVKIMYENSSFDAALDEIESISQKTDANSL